MKANKIIPAMLIALIAATSNVASAAFHKDRDIQQAQADELALARTKMKEQCQDCYEVEALVSRFLNESCHIEQTWIQSKDVMINNAMFAYLLGLKSHGVYENVYEVTIKSAQNTVDCEDDMNWVKKTKDLTVHFLM
jgi:hypothetical protein